MADAVETPLTNAIVENYLAKCDKVNPDGSTCEDIERDLIEPIAQLERKLAAVERDAARLREALQKIATGDSWPSLATAHLDDHEGDWMERAKACIDVANRKLLQTRTKKELERMYRQITSQEAR